MNEIETKALALVHSVSDYEAADLDDAQFCDVVQALCRAIEAHEADKQAFSDAIKDYFGSESWTTRAYQHFAHFIIAKPDPLVEALNECGFGVSINAADDIRAALDARGLEIVEKKS